MALSASRYVAVNSAVISAGGSALDMVGLFLTDDVRAPFGTVLAFSTAAAVASYFGLSSLQATLATAYFKGFDNSNKKPARLLFTQYATAARAAYLRGAAGLTLANVQALSGTLAITINGSTVTSSTVNLATAGSFSAAATLLQAGFTSPAFTITYDSIAGAFLVTTTATGVNTTITQVGGTLAAPLLLTTAAGAITSQGAAADTPAGAMTRATKATQNFVSFSTTFNPDSSGNANKLAFAQWADGTNARYGYVCWDQDVTATQSGNTTSLGPLLTAANLNGTELIYSPIYGATMAAFRMGALASVDYSQKNGVTNAMYRSQSGLVGEITDDTIADNLTANGYNYYGASATANMGFTFYQTGMISGEFDWSDGYFNQIWLNNALQLAGMTFLTTYKSIPFDKYGYTLVQAGFKPPIDDAVNFGMIQSGVDLSAAQIAEVNAAAGGLDVSDALYSQGYYLYVQPATAQIRGSRGPLNVFLFYTNGGAVNTINFTTTLVQ